MAKETILVVDDEANIIELARMYLQNEGYVVESARDGQEALTKIKSLQPALVVLDLMLPEVDGWEVCERIRSFSDVPILILSALGSPGSVARALDAGADDYLIKPVHASLLASRLRTLVRRRALNPDMAAA